VQLDGNIKDRFVIELRKGSILDRVWEEDHIAILQSILEVARKKKTAVATSSKTNTIDSQFEARKNQAYSTKKNMAQ